MLSGRHLRVVTEELHDGDLCDVSVKLLVQMNISFPVKIIFGRGLPWRGGRSVAPSFASR